MSITARRLREDEFGLWDAFTEAAPGGTIFHSTRWLNLIDKHIEIIAVEDEAVIKAGVALVKTKKNGVNGYHIPPYTQYFSPLYYVAHNRKHSLTEEHDCIKAILDLLKPAKHLDFKLPRGHQSILPYHWKGFDTSVTITYTLEGSLENYLQELNKNKARELKKLLQLVEEGSLIIEQEVKENDLLELLNHTTERKKFDARSGMVTSLVMNSKDSFAKKYLIRSKEHGLLAFGFFPYDGKAVYNLVNASARVNDPVLKTVNLLLLYQAIVFALNTGRKFDFEGSMLQGVEAFCRLMGGKQEPIYRVQKSASLRYSLLRAANQVRNDRK